jgi:hypothetical protein
MGSHNAGQCAFSSRDTVHKVSNRKASWRADKKKMIQAGIATALFSRTTGKNDQTVYLAVVIMLSHRFKSGLPATNTRSPSSTTCLLPPTPIVVIAWGTAKSSTDNSLVASGLLLPVERPLSITVKQSKCNLHSSYNNDPHT